jgi:hypothetical protein
MNRTLFKPAASEFSVCLQGASLRRPNTTFKFRVTKKSGSLDARHPSSKLIDYASKIVTLGVPASVNALTDGSISLLRNPRWINNQTAAG